MDPQFEELASRLTQDIAVKVDQAVSAAEERIDLRFCRRLEAAKSELKQQGQSNLEELKQQARSNLEELTRHAQANVAELKVQAQSNLKKLKQQAQSNLAELKHQAQLNQDELKDRITMAADGYGGTLESIRRALAELNSKVDTKFADHDSVLAGHHQRITALERRSST